MSAISRLAAAVTLCAASLSAVAEEAPRYNQVSLHAEVSQQVAHDLMQVTLYSENQGSDPAKLAAETTSVLNAAVADARTRTCASDTSHTCAFRVSAGG